MTLRLRLLLVLVGIVAVGLVVASVVTYTSFRSYLLSQVDSQLQSTAADAGSLESSLLPGSFLGPDSHRLFVPPGVWAQLRDSSGDVVSSPEVGFDLPTPNLPTALPGSGVSSTTPKLFDASSGGANPISYRVLAVPVIDSAGNSLGTLVLGESITTLDQTLDRLLLTELLVALAVLAALGMLAWWIVRRGLRPLDEMTTTAGAIAAGDLSRRVADTDPNTEVGQLGSALNTMLSEIEQAFGARAASEERLRRFLADASHELRTPLTSIRGYAELFDRGARDRPEDLATSMRHIREDADRMSVLVDDLLLLARLDRQRPLERDQVDLAATTAAAVEAARVAAPEREILLDSPTTAPVLGDGDRLRQVIDNLLGNAITHTPSGTPIEVRLHADPAAVGIEVTDHGPGIPTEERERIFEPFHRADPSRARSSGGVGLGLSIVSAIARAHGGSVGVVSNGVGGATFWVQIPRAAPAQLSSPDSDLAAGNGHSARRSGFEDPVATEAQS